jgi:prophage regulatory protein
MSDQSNTRQHLLRNTATRAKAGFPSSSSLYGAMERDGFPRPIKIGSRSVAWIEEEVDAWIEARRAQRDGATS